MTTRTFAPLIERKRYKGAKGGRGSGKSHFFAELLIEECLIEKATRAVCLREIQRSLKQSSKLLIEDKIEALGVSNQFRAYEDRIKTPGDGLILFEGMQNHTAQTIKSLQGFRIGWFDEAQAASEYSLGLLTPTIRVEGGELWFSWNPYSPKDPVEKLFRMMGWGQGADERWRDSDAVLIEANWYNNRWFPKVLRKDMERDRARDPDRYAHVWLGKYKQLSEARVFRNWRIEAFETPSDARFYFGADWGFANDPTCLVRCFTKGRTLYVDHEVCRVGIEIDHTPALFAGSDTQSPPRWVNPDNRYRGIEGALRWPIRADSANPQAISYMRRKGFANISPAIKGPGSIEEGVEFLKSWDIVVHPRCVHMIDELSSYAFKTDPRTEEVLPILADKKNNMIDSLRYSIELLRRAQPTAMFGTYGNVVR